MMNDKCICYIPVIDFFAMSITIIIVASIISILYWLTIGSIQRIKKQED